MMEINVYIYGVVTKNLFEFMCHPVFYGKVLSSSVNELQQILYTSSKEFSQIMTVDLFAFTFDHCLVLPLVCLHK